MGLSVGVAQPGRITGVGNNYGSQPHTAVPTSRANGLNQSGPAVYSFGASAPSPPSGGYSGPSQSQIYAQQQARATAQAKADESAYWNDQASVIERQLGQLGGQQKIGEGNINNAYNTSYNRLNEQKAIADRDYGTNKVDTTQGLLSNRNKIATSVRNRTNSIQNLLGLAGSGNSSAAQIAAPFATTREGSGQLDEVQGAFAKNMRKLDTALQDTNRDYSRNKEDLNTNRFQQMQGLKGKIAQGRASLLDKIASIKVNQRLAAGDGYSKAREARGDYQNQINSLLEQITGYGKQYANPVNRVGNVKFAAPSLDAYNYTEGGAFDIQTPAEGQINPLLIPLLRDRREEEQLA